MRRISLLTAILISATGLKAQWSTVFETNTLYGLTDISAASDDVAWACMSVDSAFRTTDGGDSWERIGLPDFGDDYQINNIYAVSADVAFICGSVIYTGEGPGIIYRTGDGGVTWQNVFEVYGNCIFSMYFKNESEGYMTVFSSNMFGVSDAYVRRTTNGGMTWTEEDTDTPTALFFGTDNDHLFGKINELWLSDIDGGLHYSDDFGETWEMIFEPEISDIIQIPAFENKNYGFAGGTDGFFPKLLRTTDGETFTPVTAALSFNVENVVVHENEVWYTIHPAIDFSVYYSNDGGETFDDQFTNFSGIKEMTPSRNGNDIWALNTSGEGKIFKYNNETVYDGEPMFDVSDLTICAGTCVNYTDLSTNDPVEWHWIFEGATPSESFDEHPSEVCYSATGDYDVTLITENADGETDTLYFDNYISVFDMAAAPTLTLDGATVTCTVMGGASIQWYIDGELIDGAVDFSITVTESGTYTAVVENYSGCISEASLYVQATTFTSSDASVCAGYCVNFTDASINSPITWNWFFEGADITTSTDQDPSGICYSVAGEYDVQLITTGIAGADTAYFENYVTVFENPEIPEITVAGATLSVPDVYATYQWYMDGEIIAGATSSIYVADENGIYLVVVANEDGCVSQNSVTVNVDVIDGIAGSYSLKVYPNPADYIAQVIISGGIQEVDHIILMNSNGELIRELDVTEITAAGMSLQVNTAALPSGFYFVKLTVDGHDTVVRSFVVAH